MTWTLGLKKVYRVYLLMPGGMCYNIGASIMMGEWTRKRTHEGGVGEDI